MLTCLSPRAWCPRPSQPLCPPCVKSRWVLPRVGWGRGVVPGPEGASRGVLGGDEGGRSYRVRRTCCRQLWLFGALQGSACLRECQHQPETHRWGLRRGSCMALQQRLCPIRSPHPVHHDSPLQTLAWAVWTQGQHHGALSALTGWSPWKPLFFLYVLFRMFYFTLFIFLTFVE